MERGDAILKHAAHAAVIGVLALSINAALAQDKAKPAPAPAKPAAEEEPFWAIGRPKASPEAMKMAPVPAFPIPTAADKLPLKKIKLPPGFKVIAGCGPTRDHAKWIAEQLALGFTGLTPLPLLVAPGTTEPRGKETPMKKPPEHIAEAA